jgi:hypothetical protein
MNDKHNRNSLFSSEELSNYLEMTATDERREMMKKELRLKINAQKLELENLTPYQSENQKIDNSVKSFKRRISDETL